MRHSAEIIDVEMVEALRGVKLVERALAGDVDAIIAWLTKFGGPSGGSISRSGRGSIDRIQPDRRKYIYPTQMCPKHPIKELFAELHARVPNEA